MPSGTRQYASSPINELLCWLVIYSVLQQLLINHLNTNSPSLPPALFYAVSASSVVCAVCLSVYNVCVDLRWTVSHFLFTLLPVALTGGRDGSVQSDASSSPSEQSQLGQSHPGYPMGPQVSEKR